MSNQENIDPSETPCLVAEDFLLASKQPAHAKVKCGCLFPVSLGSIDKGMVIAYEFQTGKFDISFGIRVNDRDVMPQKRSSSHMNTIKGICVTDARGRWFLEWDNRYSRIRSKQVLYRAVVVSKAELQSAKARAEEANEIVPVNCGDLQAMAKRGTADSNSQSLKCSTVVSCDAFKL